MSRKISLDSTVGDDWKYIERLLVHLDSRTEEAKQAYHRSGALPLWGQASYDGRCGVSVRPSELADTTWQSMRDVYFLLPPPESLTSKVVSLDGQKNDAKHFATLMSLSRTDDENAASGAERNKGTSPSEDTPKRGLKIYLLFVNIHWGDGGDDERLVQDFGLRLEAPHGAADQGLHDYAHAQYTSRPRNLKPKASSEFMMPELPESLPAIPVPATNPLELLLAALICVYSSQCKDLVGEFMQAQVQLANRVMEAWNAVTTPKSWAVPGVSNS